MVMAQLACSEKHIYVTEADLPLSCPSRDQMVWNAHPRVYLDIQAEGHVTCPYCGAHYQLVPQDSNN
ncbi:MAG: hypothetical protein CL816_06820 [Coxiellaceae bacterium]|nr:hypothetical protein [Coxiellaceae bacterium]|tara:strand:+ start:9273 stop:9473 length:201 start_codon:yes stop_codon:yes gene_type:complete